MASMPSDADLTAAIRDILHAQAQAIEGLAGLSRKVLRQHLEARFGCDLAPLKDLIKATVEHLLATDPALQVEDEDEEAEVDEATADASMEEEEEEEEEHDHDDAEMDGDFKPRRTGGFHMPYAPSPALAAVVGPEPRGRGQIVKALWNYIKACGLQDEADRRYVLCDAPLKALFDGADRVSGFGMQKYLSAHLFKLDNNGNPTQESPQPKAKAAKSPKTTPAKRSRPATRGAAAAAKKAKSASSSTTKKRGSGFSVPRKLSPQLAAVVGTDVLGRPTTVKKLWEYIKQNDLQDPTDRRYVLCDKLLREVMGEDRVSCFGMQKLLSPHIGERVDVPGGAGAEHDDGDDHDEDE
ncbi:hypothetical protein GGF31_006923 [Allomyces arbusculus]|nr:hypothetical protein GGF31_006923 [Allomyces arbusculus]